MIFNHYLKQICVLMASASSLVPLNALKTITKPRAHVNCSSDRKAYRIHGFQYHTIRRLHIVKVKAAANNGNTKKKSVICVDCDGNGAVLCSQCKGSGVNAVDFFNGQFKAGNSCWLCGGKKNILCGNCNGAGFVGGFLSTDDE